MKTSYNLSESMQNLVYWSSVHVAADDDMDSIRAAYDALCRNYTPPRSTNIRVIDGTLHKHNCIVDYRLYIPLTAVPNTGYPLVFYLHGGGFVVGGLDSHEVVTAPMAETLNAIVMSIDYRLAPEHPYPAALEDALASWQYIIEQATLYDIDINKMVIAGDSAGGNLAAVLAQATKHDEIKPVGQALIYPCLTMVESFDSHTKHANAPLLSVQDLQWYYQLYAPNVELRATQELSPLSATDFSQLPATFIAVAAFDPIADESRAYVEKLRAANVPVSIYIGQGLLHGSIRVWRYSPEVKAMYDAVLAAIAQMFEARLVH